ncbi:glycine-rich RNA-binding protein 3, mitochondrial-like [Juglans microcarpa x Juglans regia]|uniref:glycine-rich RNA-binding protein 3, mitochondrial-like n=1 Tax=Juglans microcarpa x Juglans regia TaxID=2249226 RepID=UPI001B7E9765|nr:glycine-rich RNA-binding protein 3, mitochondrial-like [Juglans microcarpa x Juglans regia]
MALLQYFPSQFSLLQYLRHPAIPNVSLSETPVPPSISPQFSSISFSRQTVLRYPSFQSLRCSPSSSSSVQDETLSSSKIFIKGLPQSMSEGRLHKAFSHYGEVSQVKLVVDRDSGQSLGFACIWFTSEDTAKLAVKEMNGKFFDGRFVYVTIAKPGFIKNRRRATQYKF